MADATPEELAALSDPAFLAMLHERYPKQAEAFDKLNCEPEIARYRRGIQTREQLDAYCRELLLLDAEYEARKEAFEAWARRNRSERASIEFLNRYDAEITAMRIIDEENRGKPKSRQKSSAILDYAEVGITNVQPSIELSDPTKTIAYLYKHLRGKYVKVIESVDLAGLKPVAKKMLEDGEELIPGFEQTPAKRRFNVSLKGAK